MSADGSSRATKTADERLAIDVLEGNIQLLAEKERLEHERQRLERRDRQRTDFLAHISSDLRTPLNSILGFAELLLADPERDRRDAEYLRAIHRNGRSLLAVIGDLLDLASIESHRLHLRTAPASVADIVDDVREAMAPRLAESGVAVAWPDPVAGCGLACDRRRIVQALGHLIDHARRQTPVGGRVALTVEDGEAAVAFAVEDGGPGLPVEAREAAFAPFFVRNSGDRPGGTLGLGLAIARGIAEGHGGRIEVDGRGVRLTLVIPRQAAS